MAITNLDASIATLTTNVATLIAQGKAEADAAAAALAGTVPQSDVDTAQAQVDALNATVVAAITPAAPPAPPVAPPAPPVAV